MAKFINAKDLAEFIRGCRSSMKPENYKSATEFHVTDEMLLKFEQMVQHFPTADVAEVVYCKDCKFSHKQGEHFLACDHLLRSKFITDNDFCSYGERKDG